MVKERRLIGLIGANIMKSLSPALHEDAFAAIGIKGHYHLMDLERLPGRTLQDLLGAVRTAGFLGVNVTYPCKEAVLALLDEVVPEARQIGAVNTVAITPEGRTTGHNTDRMGFRRSFEEVLGRAAAAGRHAMLVGAGGAGRAVAFAMLDLGVARLSIFDVDAERRTRLAVDLAGHFPDRQIVPVEGLAEAMAGAHGLVNATPIGMLGRPGNPVPAELLRSDMFVCDIIYTPLVTELIAAARAAGARTLTGDGMNIHQAAEAFRIFTGSSPDIERVRATFAAALAERDGLPVAA